MNGGLGSLQPSAGQRALGWLRVPRGWALPGFVVRGEAPGPTLSVIAGLHGGEVAAVQALRQLASLLKPERFRGVVRGVICVNMPAFTARVEHVNPMDGVNLNRIFPGDGCGTASFRVVDFVMTRVIQGSDAFVDLHGGDRSEALMPYAMFPVSGTTTVDTTAEALAVAYGLPLVGHASVAELPGRAWVAGGSVGVPSILAEAGGQGRASGAAVQIHIEGLSAVMATLGMRAEVPRSVVQPRRSGKVEFVSAAQDGVFESVAVPGTLVRCGADLGTVFDVLGTCLQELHSPCRGTVVMVVDALSVRRGEHLVGIAREA